MGLQNFNTEQELYFHHEFINDESFSEQKKKSLEKMVQLILLRTISLFISKSIIRCYLLTGMILLITEVLL